MTDFFISRNGADRSWGQWIAWELEEAGYQVIIQDWDFRPSSNFISEMNRAAAEAERTIAVLSPSYLTARFSEAEWAAALAVDPTGAEGRLLVVRVRPCEPPPLLRAIVRIDLDGLSQEEARERLLAGVRRGRAKPGAPPSFPGVSHVAVTDVAPFPPVEQRARVSAGMVASREARATLVSSDAGAPTVVGVPVSLALGAFRDRITYRRQLRQLLDSPEVRLVTVVGRRGIGKSALTARVLRDIEDGSGEGTGTVQGLIYISSRTRTREITLERIVLDVAAILGDAGDALLRAWTDPNLPVADKAHAALDALAGGRYVILLDNLEDVQTPEGGLRDPDLETFLEAVLTHPADVTVATTSRLPLTGDLRRYARQVDLDEGLPDEDAIALLCELDADDRAGLRDLEEEQLLELVRRVYGMPHALVKLFSMMIDDPLLQVDTLLDSFSERSDVIEELLHEQLRRLDQDAVRVVQALAVFRRPVEPAALDAVLQPVALGINVLPVISRLALSHAVDVDRARQLVALHPLDSDLTRAGLPADGQEGRRAWESRAADWYAGIASPPGSWQSVDDLEPQLAEFTHRLQAEQVEEAAKILVEVDDFLVWNGSVRRVEKMHQALGGRVRDPRLRARLALGQGLVRLLQGPVAEAPELFETAIDLARTAGDRPTEGLALSLVGDSYRILGQLEDAVGALLQAEVVQQDLDEPQEYLWTLLRLGLAHVYRGDDAAALEVAGRMEQMVDKLQDPDGQARLSDLRSLISLVAGRFEESASHAARAIELYGQSGTVEATGFVWNVRGLAYLAMGRLDEAVHAFETGRIQGVELRSPRIIGLCAYNLAVTHWRAGRRERAAAAVQAAIDVLSQHDPVAAAAAHRLNAALSAVADGDPATAVHELMAAGQQSGTNADLAPGWLLAELAEHVGAGTNEQHVAVDDVRRS